MSEKDQSVVTIDVPQPKVEVEGSLLDAPTQRPEKHNSWKKRVVKGLAAVGLTGLAAWGTVEVVKYVSRERQQDKAALKYLEATDAKFIKEEREGTRKIRLIGDVAILREGVEVRANCFPKDTTPILKPGTNLVAKVPAGQMLVVPLPVRQNQNDGTYWIRFSMMNKLVPLLENGAANPNAAFSADQVAARNVCVSASEYVNKTTKNGEPLVSYHFDNDNGENTSTIPGVMDSNGIIRTPDRKMAATASYMTDGLTGNYFLDNLLGVAEEIVKQGS